MTTRLLPLITALLVASGVAATDARAVQIGIADQKPQTFKDPRWTALHLPQSRLVVSWDAMRNPWEVQQIDTWLRAAKAGGIRQPLIGIMRSRARGRGRLVPSPAQYLKMFRRFRARYPRLKTFSLWNEPNLSSQAMSKHPDRLVAYYRGARRACRSCTILAGELIDQGNMVPWMRAFQARLGRSPMIWGLHNYRDVNRMQTTTMRKLLAATRAKIWITETGGIVARRDKRHKEFPMNPKHAAQATKWLFTRIVPLSSRIRRVYLYHWSAARRDRWDSAFIDPHGRARPALKVLRQQLPRFRRGT